MAGRLPKTLTDYVVIAIIPALIMLLVGSLVFFLVTAFYQGAYQTRLLFIFAMFVLAAVLIGRISMEQGTEYASLFAVPLAIVTGLAMWRFVELQGPLAGIGWLINLGLIALIWWATHKLTWDCTLIDEHEDAAGEGLLQLVGLDQVDGAGDRHEVQRARGLTPAAPSGGSPRSWWQWLTERRRQPHAPGKWVVYFSLAALPLFGLGQWMIPSSDTESRRFAFQLLFCYVASGLALLLTTSFLGLRRYLRQRQIAMPHEMTAVWLGAGGVLILVLLVFCSLLPRPSGEFALGELPVVFRAPSDVNPNRYGLGNDGPQADSGQQGSSQQGSSQQGSSQQGSSQQGSSQQGSSQQGSSQQGSSQQGSSQQGSSQQGSSQQGSSQQGSSQQGSSQQGSSQQGSSQQGSSQKGSSQQGSSQQGSSQQGSSQQGSSQQGSSQQGSSQQGSSQQGSSQQGSSQQGSSQQGSSQQGSSQQGSSQQGSSQQGSSQQGSSQQGSSQQGSSQQGSSQQGSSQQGSSQQGSSQQGSNQQADRQGGESPTNQAAGQASSSTMGRNEMTGSRFSSSEGQTASDSDRLQSESRRARTAARTSGSQRSSLSLAGVGQGLAWLLKLLFYAGLLGVGGYLAWRHRQQLREAVARVLRQLRELWQRLTGRDREAAAVAPEATLASRPARPFSDFRNPFSPTGGATLRPDDLVKYSFEALEAWAREHGCPRAPEQTAHEFAVQLAGRSRALGPPVQVLADLYAQLAYAGIPADSQRVNALQALWQHMQSSPSMPNG